MAQQVIVKGVVKDDKGQLLPQSHIAIFPDSVFTVTNSEGRFVMRAIQGEKQLKVSYLGFEIFSRVVTLKNDTVWAISLKPQANQLEEIVISGKRDPLQEIFDDNQTSTHVLTQDDINAIPVLGGEADVIATVTRHRARYRRQQ